MRSWTPFDAQKTSGRRPNLGAKGLRRVKEYVDTRLDQVITLTELSDVACLSTCHFARAFKESAGLTPMAYVQTRRIDEVAAAAQIQISTNKK